MSGGGMSGGCVMLRWKANRGRNPSPLHGGVERGKLCGQGEHEEKPLTLCVHGCLMGGNTCVTCMLLLWKPLTFTDGGGGFVFVSEPIGDLG